MTNLLSSSLVIFHPDVDGLRVSLAIFFNLLLPVERRFVTMRMTSLVEIIYSLFRLLSGLRGRSR
jgi:hypothetical protein